MSEGVAIGAWRRVDRMVAAYGVFVVVVAATRLDRPGVGLVLLAHLALPLLAWLATRAPDTGVGGVLRAVYPGLLLTGLYSAIDVLNGAGAARTWDAPLQALEATIFGGQPARDWWQAAPSAFWSSLLHAVYFSYYLIVPLPIIVFLVTRRRAAIGRYLDAVIATFLLCYVAYILVPVAGPYYEFVHPSGPFVDNGPARLVYATLAKGSAFGAAFPSSHVAATVAATMAAWLESRRLGLVLLVPTALLAVGVVYCQMHYVIDSAAGIALGLGLPMLLRRRD